MIPEKFAHLLRALEIKFRHITHPFFVLHHLARADADHDVVRFVMAPFEKVNVVRRHQPEPEFTPDFWQNTVAFSLRLQSVIVQLEEEILRAKDIAKGRCALPRLLELIGLDRHVDLALEAGAHPDQPFRVCCE